MVKVLIVDDDPGVRDILRYELEAQGWDVAEASNAAEIGEALKRFPPDLILLDLRLPDQDGLTIAARLRATSSVPIIMLTGLGSDVDRIVGLEMGADDYVVKPFGQRELIARIRAVHRRTAITTPPDDDQTEIGPLTIDRRARAVTVDQRPIQLTPKEYDLLAFLADDAGAVLTRDEILRNVWDQHWFGSSKTLDVHMASLRKKLGLPDLIETVRGVGFRIVLPDQP